MGKTIRTPQDSNIIMHNKVFGWIAAITGIILLIPLIAMQFTNEVAWSFGDFIIIGIMLFGAGSLFVLTARVVPKKYWIVLGVIFAVAVLWAWAELAVGIFTNLGT